MKIKTFILFIVVLLIGTLLQAQQRPFYKSYRWNNRPSYNIDASDSVKIVTLKDKFVDEFIYNDRNELIEYLLVHKIIWLNSDEEIEKNNKIYLPYSETSELVLNKARVVTKTAKVIELDDSKIMTAEDEETKQIYKYFTFEGVEKGSFIEYYFVLRKFPELKGKRVAFQTENQKYNIEYDLYSANNLVFEFKSYNGFPDIELDTTSTDKLHWFVRVDTLATLEREDRAPYNACKQFFIYKLDRNLATRTFDISSYAGVSENVYSFLYDGISKSETKSLEKFLKLTGANKQEDEQTKIRTLEDYIKKNIYLVDASNNDLEDIQYILKNNVASKTGMLLLYTRLFKLMDIKTQVVFSSNREDLKFDKEFEANIFLQEHLLYFPKIKKYLSPVELYSRLGFPPSYLTNNYGLFIKEVSVGEIVTGIGKIKFIEPLSSDKSFDILNIELKFDEDDITTTNMNISKSSGGYYSMYIQPFMHLFDEKTKTEVVDEYIKYLNDDIEIISKEIKNDNAEDFGIKPFIVDAEVTTDSYVEKAGNKYLFKIGELIGLQMEMYQEKKRVLPLETAFNRMYHREITFSIPQLYTINNLDDIIINNEYKKDGEILMKFVSSYEVEGNQVKLVCDEFYDIIEISPEIFEDYRKIVNSAADFNKITLILEKKSE